MKCAICGIRKPRRFCPGVGGEICTICCGTEREQSVDCPFHCEYLREAHLHEKVEPVDPLTLPNQDIRVPEPFLEENEKLLVYIAVALFEGALNHRATDYDVRKALESLVQTYRTLNSGLIYESRPANPFAAAIADNVQERLTMAREKELEVTGRSTIRDAAILGVLVFLQRLEFMHNNGRPKSKAFLDVLSGFALGPVYDSEDAGDPAGIVDPDEPLIIL